MELSELQTKILNAPSNRSIVLSAAASGKTRLMTEKVRQLLRAGVNPREIAVITFTNMAAAELRGRLGEDYVEGLFVGTIHALANWMLLSGGVKTTKILQDEEFDELFSLIKENPQCIRHMEWILLDEAQDSSESQFEFLFETLNPDYFFVCGDLRQSIYRWRAARPDLLQSMCKDPNVTVFDMNENYRNGYNILSFAKSLISPTGLEDTSVSKRNINGTVTTMSYDSQAILSKIKEDGHYGDWVILTRTNKEISTFALLCNRYGVPYETFKQADLSKEELTEKMQHNTVKLLTVHSAKGLEWKNAVVIGMRYSSVEERCICYVAATRARDNLIWVTGKKKANPRNRTYNW